jgi:hypothetical protein
MKILRILVAILLFWLFIFVGCSGKDKKQAALSSSEQSLSSQKYVDPKGFFEIIPPAGWSIQEYPNDPRGKVAFTHPKGEINLRVLTNVVDFNNIEELIASCKDIEKRTGLSTNIERVDFLGTPAVKRAFEAQGQKFYAIDILVGKTDHNLQYGAPQSKYEKYLPIVIKSMETYEPVFRDVSDQDHIKNLVAKKLRLAQLMLENGKKDLALQYIKEGLEISPQNPDLLKMKQQIEQGTNR